MLHEIAPHKFHIEYRNTEAKADDYILLCIPGKIYTRLDGETIVIPTISQVKNFEAIKDRLIFICGIDDRSVFSVLDTDEKEADEMIGGYGFTALHPVRRAVPQHMVYTALTAFRIWVFYHTNRFCGCCGSPAKLSIRERAMVCTECGHTVYPPIAPSVIVAIRDGEKLLVTRYQESHNPYRGYSLVAGYVETGETPIETIHREVMEEVGLKVKNINFFDTQPWPVSGSLLLGYYCDLDTDEEMKIDEDELELAEWIDRKDLPDRSKDVSLTSKLIESFRLGEI